MTAPRTSSAEEARNALIYSAVSIAATILATYACVYGLSKGRAWAEVQIARIRSIRKAREDAAEAHVRSFRRDISAIGAASGKLTEETR